MTKNSRPVYPTKEARELENYTGRPMYEGSWHENQEAEIESLKNQSYEKINDNYQMEIGEEIVFEDLNSEDLNEESRVDIDSIIRNMDMSDHNYRDNVW